MKQLIIITALLAVGCSSKKEDCPDQKHLQEAVNTLVNENVKLHKQVESLKNK